MEKNKKPVIEPFLLTVPQAAKALGISRAMLYKLIKSGELPCIHIGRAARVRVSDLRRLIQAHEHNEASR